MLVFRDSRTASRQQLVADLKRCKVGFLEPITPLVIETVTNGDWVPALAHKSCLIMFLNIECAFAMKKYIILEMTFWQMMGYT